MESVFAAEIYFTVIGRLAAVAAAWINPGLFQLRDPQPQPWIATSPHGLPIESSLSNPYCISFIFDVGLEVY